MEASVFQARVLDWFDRNGRKDLPWQLEKTPYRVWVSEIMLQQTQVKTVLPYFHRFIAAFPEVSDLAAAPLDQVLGYWSGLGYYARARNLHKAAISIDRRGGFPQTLAELMALPGIGRSTAGAILSIAFNDSHAILDGNVKRVLSRFNGVFGWPGRASIAKRLWAVSDAYTPVRRVADYTQAMMDLGATLCTRSQPNCQVCPLSDACYAYRNQCIGDLPTAKPKAEIPVQQKAFLILRNRQQRILLCKRPPIGIWGGLWSLPEFDDHNLAVEWQRRHFQALDEVELLPVRRHSFSHFHLDYQPIVANITDSVTEVMEAGQTVWYNMSDEQTLGLPAPVKKLLEEIKMTGEKT